MSPRRGGSPAGRADAGSGCVARACAAQQGLPLYRYFAQMPDFGPPNSLPRPTVNLFSGGAHAGGQVPLQDLLILPLRAERMDESLEIITRTMAGESVTLDGRHYQVKDVQVTPPPIQQPFPLWVGARSEAAARRAARFRANLMIVADRPVYDAWADALREQGDDPSDFEVLLSAGGYVSDDPDALWEELKPHQRYLRDTYGKWYNDASDLGEQDPLGQFLHHTDEDLRARFVAGTPDEVAAAIERTLDWIPADHIITSPVPPGASRDLARRSIELFAQEVMPRFR